MPMIVGQEEELDPVKTLTGYTYIIDFVLILIVIVVYTIVLVMICTRRELQPLKVKNYKLIFCSVFASGLLIVSNLALKIIKNYMHDLFNHFQDKDKELLESNTLKQLHDASCLIKTFHGGILAPMMLVPYFFRAFKLKAIFD